MNIAFLTAGGIAPCLSSSIVSIIKNYNKLNKEYKFIGTRIKMNKPKIVNFNGKEIKYYYKNVVTRYEKYYNKLNE